MAAAHGLHPNLVSQWRDQALAAMVSLFSRAKETDWAAKETAHEQEKQELYAEIGRLTTQLSWLKKKLANSLSRGERLALVERAAGEVSVVVQCELLSVHRSGVYYIPRPVDAHALARIPMNTSSAWRSLRASPPPITEILPVPLSELPSQNCNPAQV